MKLFSFRKGIKKFRDSVQLNSLDEATSNRIWNALCSCYWDNIERERSGLLNKSLAFLNVKYFSIQTYYFQSLWSDFFKYPIDTLKNDWHIVYGEIRDYFFKCEWNEIFDFLEFTIQNFPDHNSNTSFKILCNKIFEEELVGYRFVDNSITEILSNIEINEIEEALDQNKKSIKTHLQRAVELLSVSARPGAS